jgi:DNA adenine methylase
MEIARPSVSKASRDRTDRAALEAVRPILKWAGGKRQLLPALRRHYPSSFDRYVEPFLGSGAVFLDCHNQGLLEGRDVLLSDINADLIGCYRTVRDDVEGVIGELRTLEDGHRSDGDRHFYAVRDERFNELRRGLQGAADLSQSYTPAMAAMLIYLNRTGYNGLFRVNARGAFNVPAGRYRTVTICDAPNLRRLSAVLRRPGLRVEARRFEDALAAGRAGDFMYLDPPYSPVSRTAHFTAYTAGGFASGEQAHLQRLVVALARRRVSVLLSNSVAPETRRLYEEDAEVRSAGLRTFTVPARRAINSSGAGRGAVREYLITNIV